MTFIHKNYNLALAKTDTKELLLPIANDLKVPGGAPAGDINRIQLLLMWAKEYEQRAEKIKYLGVGHPSAAINPIICSTSLKYWQALKESIHKFNSIDLVELSKLTTKQVVQLCTQEDVFKKLPSLGNDLINADSKETLKIDMAEGFNSFYGLYPGINNEGTKIEAKSVLPTQGGGGGLHILFNYLDKENPHSYLALQIPYYTLYNVGPQGINNKLVFFRDVEELFTRLEEFETGEKKISAVVFCNPNNPTGKVFSEPELEQIVEIVVKLGAVCIFDEAYVEVNFSDKLFVYEFFVKKMDFINNHISGEEQKKQKVIYEAFLKLLIILRSGTKGFSSSGQRNATLIGFDEILMKKLSQENYDIGFPPTSSQVAYSQAIRELKPRFIDNELTFLSSFYEEQVRYVEKKLNKMNIAYIGPYNNYDKVEGTFYVLTNLKSLIGFQIKDHKTQTKLKEIGLRGEELTTDEDIAYYLLVKYGVMLTYLSPWGESPQNGLLRITCSGGKALFDEAFDGIQAALTEAKKQNISIRQKSLCTQQQQTERPVEAPQTKMKLEDISSLPTSFCNLLKTDDNVKTFVPPPLKFIICMENYWEEYCKKSEKVGKIRSNHLEISIDNLKALLKFHFVGAIFKLVVERAQLEVSEEGLFILQHKKQALLNVIGEVSVHLKKHHALEISGFSFLLKIVEEFSTHFDKQAKNFIDKDILIFFGKHIQKYAQSRPPIDKSNFLMGEMKLFSELVFEKIYYDIFVEGKNSPFSEFVSKVYLSRKDEINDKFSLIEKIVSEHAVIDYTHPKGDDDKRAIMAKALNLWYGKNFIDSNNILFVSIKPIALLQRVFGKIFSLDNEVTVQKNPLKCNKWEASIVCNPLEKLGENLEEKQRDKTTAKIREYLDGSEKNFIVIDESYVERCVVDENMPFGKQSLLTKLIENSKFKERIILIRSAMSIFSPSAENISIVITLNQTVMAKLLDKSINMHVHAPQSLQHGYTHTMYEFITNMYTSSKYRDECIKYIHLLSKYYLALTVVNMKREGVVKNDSRTVFDVSCNPPPIIFSQKPPSLPIRQLNENKNLLPLPAHESGRASPTN